MKFKITIITVSKTSGKDSIMVLEGQITKADRLTMNPNASTELDSHDIAARLFALEFAANNHSELPMRVHIEQQ